jgi:hypothetical protein
MHNHPADKRQIKAYDETIRRVLDRLVLLDSELMISLSLPSVQETPNSVEVKVWGPGYHTGGQVPLHKLALALREVVEAHQRG